MPDNFWHKLKKPIIALAPMAGVNDSAFRQLVMGMGCDACYTEMVSADALYYNSRKTMDMLKLSRQEKPVVVQLFGKRPETFSKAAQIAAQAGFDGIDINFGCPARKVVAHGGGVTLMKEPDKSREIIKAVLDGAKMIPVSIKVRTSIKKGARKITIFDFYKKISDLKIKAIMLHGRSYEQGFDGPPDYRVIKEFKRLVGKNHILLGNGGISSPEDAAKMIQETGCDGIGIARGARSKPWIFRQVKDYLSRNKYNDFTPIQIKKIALKHAKLAYKSKGEKGIIEMRKFLLWYFRSFPKAAELRKKIVSIETYKDITSIFSF